MSKGMFDPESFLSQKVGEKLDTAIIPCPPGNYVGLISKIDIRSWVKKDDPTISGVNLDVLVRLNSSTPGNEAILEECGVEEIIVKGGIRLDINDEGTGLAKGKGKNVPLGKLLEAVGLNNGDSELNDLLNQLVLVKVVQEVVDDELYAKITKFASPADAESE